ncbi:MAG: D-2-hydroxyacid dehydrogenase [Luteolibacter sp.]
MKSKILSLSLTLLASTLVAHANPSSKALAEELGSLRNAKVAIKLSDPEEQLTYFTQAVSKEEKAELARIAPNLRLVTGLSKKEALARAEEAQGIDASYATPEFLEKATNLAWIQVMSAGVDRYTSLMKDDKIVLTNFRGVHGPAIADHAMAMLLYKTRNLDFYTDQQKKSTWSRGRAPKKAVTLEGKTMFVVGVGGIGTEIAKRAHGFGMRVIGTRRSDTPSPDFIEKTGKPDDLLAYLAEADVVALAVPLTPETENLLDEKAFAAMKPGTFLINIARGKVVNTDAMLKALDSGKLAAACLDVTDPEPLPKDSPLWSHPEVIITPHISSRSEVTDQRRAALLRENLRRFSSAEPLLNVVDKELGY